METEAMILKLWKLSQGVFWKSVYQAIETKLKKKFSMSLKFNFRIP